MTQIEHNGTLTIINYSANSQMHKTLSVFFSGTGHQIDDKTTLAGLLKNHINQSDTQKVMGFDGCAITHGMFRGGIFGAGLDEVCQKVVDEVAKEIKQGNTVTLNIYGHSRGGISALMLAKELGAVNPELLDINLALLDPVPGNLVTTSTLDPFNICLANKTMDLRDCQPLTRVLAIYPYKPLSAIQGHAPLFCQYPSHTEIEEEAVAGCHAGAQFNSPHPHHLFFENDSFITFARMMNFLRDNGSEFTPFPPLALLDDGCKKSHLIYMSQAPSEEEQNAFDDSRYIFTGTAFFYYNKLVNKLDTIDLDEQGLLNIREIFDTKQDNTDSGDVNLVKTVKAHSTYPIYPPNSDSASINAMLLKAYERANSQQHNKSSRSCHSANGLGIYAKEEAEYYNLDHQRLAGVPEDQSKAKVTIEENKGPLSRLKRVILHYPKTWQTIKWTVLSLALTGLIVSTAGLGGLAALGALGLVNTTLILAPVVGAAAAALWYKAVKPFINWVVNHINYPFFRVQAIQPDHNPGAGSPRTMVEALGVQAKKSAEETPAMTATAILPRTNQVEPNTRQIPEPSTEDLGLSMGRQV